MVADTEQARTQVYRLRYERYRREGSLAERSDEQFSDAFDEKPNSFSFLARNAEHQALATVRITVVRPGLGWTDSPVAHAYGDHTAFQAIARENRSWIKPEGPDNG